MLGGTRGVGYLQTRSGLFCNLVSSAKRMMPHTPALGVVSVYGLEYGLVGVYLQDTCAKRDAYSDLLLALDL